MSRKKPEEVSEKPPNKKKPNVIQTCRTKYCFKYPQAARFNQYDNQPRIVYYRRYAKYPCIAFYHQYKLATQIPKYSMLSNTKATTTWIKNRSLLKTIQVGIKRRIVANDFALLYLFADQYDILFIQELQIREYLNCKIIKNHVKYQAYLSQEM